MTTNEHKRSCPRLTGRRFGRRSRRLKLQTGQSQATRHPQWAPTGGALAPARNPRTSDNTRSRPTTQLQTERGLKTREAKTVLHPSTIIADKRRSQPPGTTQRELPHRYTPSRTRITRGRNRCTYDTCWQSAAGYSSSAYVRTLAFRVGRFVQPFINSHPGRQKTPIYRPPSQCTALPELAHQLVQHRLYLSRQSNHGQRRQGRENSRERSLPAWGREQPS